jgi:hypothetical protein
MATASSARPINPAVTKASIIYFLSTLFLSELVRSQAEGLDLPAPVWGLDNPASKRMNISEQNCSHYTAASSLFDNRVQDGVALKLSKYPSLLVQIC